MSWIFSYTVDNISNDKVRFQTTRALGTGQASATSLMISKFE